MLFLTNEQQTLNFDLYVLLGGRGSWCGFFGVVFFFYDSPYSPHRA